MCSPHNCSFENRPEVLVLVNDLLDKKYSAKKIEAMAGLSHSQVGRHQKHCFIKSRAAQMKKQLNPASTRILTQWPMDGPDPDWRGKVTYYGDIIPPDKIGQDDVLLAVEYDKSGFFKNPIGLTCDGVWTAEAQSLFLTRCSLKTKADFIDDEHQRALLENAERDFAADPQLSNVEAQLSDQNNLTCE
jgi:hypothetical protein